MPPNIPPEKPDPNDPFNKAFKWDEVRKQYPEYDDLSDIELARGLHQKFYSDIEFDDFVDRSGLGYVRDQQRRQIDDRVATFEANGGNDTLVTLGRGFDAMGLIGRALGNRLGVVDDQALLQDIEDYQLGADPRMERLQMDWEDADGVLESGGALVQNYEPIGRLLLEQLPGMLVGGGAGSQVAKGAGMRLANETAKRALIGAGTGAGATAAGGGGPNVAEGVQIAMQEAQQQGMEDPAQIQQYIIDRGTELGFTRTAVESAIASLSGMVTPFRLGPGAASDMAAQTAVQAGSGALEEYAGAKSVGQDASSLEVTLGGLLEAALAPVEVGTSRGAYNEKLAADAVGGNKKAAKQLNTNVLNEALQNPGKGDRLVAQLEKMIGGQQAPVNAHDSENLNEENVDDTDSQLNEADQSDLPTAADVRQNQESKTPGPKGASSRIYTADGKEYETTWQVVDGKDLKPAVDQDENQARKRRSAASQAQINAIAKNPTYGRLSGSPEMDTGAPTVMPDGTVIGGNGRVLGILQAYESGAAGNYRAELEADAAAKGIPPESIAAMENPVLVRVLPEGSNVREMALKSNEGGSSRMSATEQAAVDAERIGHLEDFVVNDAGAINVPGNRDFIRRAIATMPANDQGDLIDSKGRLSQEGLARVRNAVLNMAYGDNDAMGQLIESTDTDIQNVLNALLRAAPTVAKSRKSMESGDLHQVDLVPDLMDAVDLLTELKASGNAVADLEGQGDWVGREESQLAVDLAKFMEQNSRSAKRMAEFITGFYDKLASYGNPKDGSLFGEQPAPTAEDLTDGIGQPGRSDASASEEQTSQGGGKYSRDAGAGQEGAARDTGRNELELESYTERDLADRQESLDRAAAQEKTDQEAADRKDKADRERDDFQLTGSDRAADANPNQGSLFARGQKRSDLSIDDVKTALTDAFGESVTKLINAGKLQIVANAQDLPAGGRPSSSSLDPVDQVRADKAGNQDVDRIFPADLTEGLDLNDKPSRKAWAKRVDAPDSLPDRPERYFQLEKADGFVSIDMLQSEDRADTAVNAAKFMAAAHDGDLGLRDPVPVRQNPDGTYTALDGNSTIAAAKKYGWTHLPVAVEGKASRGADERIRRAKAQGFDTDTVFYHGARPGSDIESFNIPEHDGAYFTPDTDYAEAYTLELFSKEKKQGAIYPVYLRLRNPLEIIAEDGSDEWDKYVYRGFNKKDLVEQGYDSIKLIEKNSGELDQVIVFDGSNVRSVNAQFDGDKQADSNILYSRSNSIKGYYDGSTAYLVASNLLDEAEAVGVFLHEVGEHSGMEKMLGDQYQDLVSQFDRLLADGDTWAKRAADKVPENTPAADVASERLAYLVQIVSESNYRAKGIRKAWSLVRDMVSAIRAWFYTTDFYKNAWKPVAGRVNLSPSDIAALARRAVEFEASNTADTPKVGNQGRINKGQLTASQFRRVDRSMKEAQRAAFPADIDDFIDHFIRSKRAAAAQQQFIEIVEESIEGLSGVTLKNPGNKANIHRIREKVNDKYDGQAWHIGDIVRGGLIVENLDDIETIIDRLSEQMPVIDEDWAVSRLGYFDRKLAARLPNGVVTELQMWHPEMYAAKVENGGQLLYTEARTPSTTAERRAEIMRESMALYEDALSRMPEEWRQIYYDAFGRESGSGGKSAMAPTSMKDGTRSGGMTAPSNMASEKSKGSQASPSGGSAKATPSSSNTAMREARISDGSRGRAKNETESNETIRRTSKFSVTNGDESVTTDYEQPVEDGGFFVGRDADGRAIFKPGAKVYDAGAQLATAILSKVGLADTMPKSMKKTIRQYTAEKAKAMGTALDVAKMAEDFTPAERALVTQIIEDGIGSLEFAPPDYLVDIAAKMTTLFDQQSQELVELNMISEESRERWKGQYIPRFYKKRDATLEGMIKLFKQWRQSAKGIGGSQLKGRGLFEDVPLSDLKGWVDAGWEVRGNTPDIDAWYAEHIEEIPNNPDLLSDGGQLPAGLQPNTRIRVWRDFTPAERAKMGEVRDALYRFARGYLSTQEDLAMGRMFKRISEDPELAGNIPKNGDWVEVPKTNLSGTGGVKRYGALAGMYVHPEVYEHLKYTAGYDRNQLMKGYLKALAWWKEGKTAMNPAVHTNNVVSNVAMATFAGIPPWRLDIYKKAAAEYRKQGDIYNEALDLGLLSGDITSAEFEAFFPEITTLADGAAEVQRQNALLATLAKLKNASWDKYRDTMRSFYQAEDQFFKLMIFMDQRSRGVDADEAVEFAERFIFNYSLLPSGAKRYRDFLLPFFSYTYFAVPAVLRTAMRYPHRFALPILFWQGINLISYAMQYEDDDDREEFERTVMPGYMKGNNAMGIPKVVRLMNAENGDAVFLDIYRWLPLGDIFDVHNQIGGLPIPAPLTPNNPIFSLYMGLIGNKDPYFGDEVVPEATKKFNADTGQAEWTKKSWTAAAKWTAGQLLPSTPFVPGSYHFSQIMEGAVTSLNDGEPIGPYTGMTRGGTPVTLDKAIRHALGIKDRRFSPEEQAIKARLGIVFRIKDLQSAMRQTARRKDITHEARQKQLAELKAQIRSLGDQIRDMPLAPGSDQ